ncbi:MAG: DUF1549 domain-containing protein [Pirellulaceae bacterium]
MNSGSSVLNIPKRRQVARQVAALQGNAIPERRQVAALQGNALPKRRQVAALQGVVFYLILVFGMQALAAEPVGRIQFSNDVVPILTKAGCNAGACHAKAGGGQNGFQLSLLGYEPAEDFDHLVTEGRGRRLFPSVPEQSLLLLKATGTLPHGGGQRFAIDSPEYQVLLRWIEQGMPPDDAAAPQLVSIEVAPPSITALPNTHQQLRALANFSDGSQRDVTHLTLFESNEPAMAEVDRSGLVTTGDLPGKVALMVRFRDKVAVCNTLIPLGQPIDSLPPAKNFIDEGIFASLRELGLPPSELCDDATFLRRASLDIIGRLPTIDEAKTYYADAAEDRRAKWVDNCCAQPRIRRLLCQ